VASIVERDVCGSPSPHTHPLHPLQAHLPRQHLLQRAQAPYSEARERGSGRAGVVPCRPSMPTAAPTLPGSWAKEGGGWELEKGAAVRPHARFPDPEPSPSTAPLHAPGVSGPVIDTQRAGRSCLQEEGTRGGRMSGDPPGERCQAGGQRAGSSGRWRPLQGSRDTAGWMLVPPSLCPSRAAPLQAVLRPGGRC
jgi:hypothetical protein